MIRKKNSDQARQKRHRRIRSRLHGTTERPRLSVFRSLKHMYAQVIDDSQGRTIAAASTLDDTVRPDLGSLQKRDEAAGITQVVFDRGGYLYHGRVQKLAEAAREAGLTF